MHLFLFTPLFHVVQHWETNDEHQATSKIEIFVPVEGDPS